MRPASRSTRHDTLFPHMTLCLSAPVHDPVTGRPLGVIDLSTTWDRSHPIGLATARVMARLIETALPTSSRSPATGVLAPDQPGLTLTLLRSEEPTSALQSLMRISYAVFCLKTKNTNHQIIN